MDRNSEGYRQKPMIVDGEVFNYMLACAAKGNVDTIWTENKRHFKECAFLSVENPLEWTRKEE